MKRVLSAFLVCVLLVGVVLSLASCGKMLSGTYKSTLAGTYEFKGKKVTYSPLIGNPIEGTYKIEKGDDGDMTITFDFDDDKAENDGIALPFSEGKEDGKAYVKILGVKYTKE